MKTLCFILVLISSTLMANDNQINLSTLQRLNLGIKIGSLKKIENIPLLNAPATVAIPPDQEYIVSSSQAGLVKHLNKTVGDYVKKGQLLAKIKSPELLALQQNYLHAISKRQLAWVSFQRDKKLLEGGIIANKRLQETRSRYNSEDIEVNAARQLLAIAGMPKNEIKTLAKIQHLHSELNIYAPISGFILEKMVVAGERLDSLSPLYRIANLNALWLEINIPQEQASLVKIGDQVTIDNSLVPAEITLLTQSVNVNNQSVLARAIIKGKDAALRVGQNVNVRIKHGVKKIAFEVPNVAIAQSAGQAYIFIETKTGFLIKAVKIIGQQGKFSVITGELVGLEKIALRGAAALKANWQGLGSED